ncbi:MAG: autotransporter-associated beta strand repeat-containing protein, partial [Planctomycetota bacterium]
MVSCPVLSAATCVWNGGAGNWNTAGNWTGGVPGNTDIADVSAGGTITVDVAKQVGQITGTLVADLTIDGAFALTINNATGITALTTATGKVASISCPMVMAVDQTWDVGTTLTITGAITGAMDLIWNGAGTVVFGNSTAWAPTVTVNSGTIRVSHVSGLAGAGVATVTVNAATVEVAGITLANPILVMNNGSTLKGTGIAAYTRAYTLTTAGTATFTYGSATDVFTVSGAISGQGSLTIAGEVGTVGGKVVLSSNSSAWNNGNITVQQYATLEATTSVNSLGIAGGTGTITVNNGGTLRYAITAAASLSFAAKPITVSGDGADGLGAIIGVNNGANFATVNGAVTLAADSSFGGTANTSVLSGVISGAFNVAKKGTGSWALSGNNTAWSGNITVEVGTLVANIATNTDVLGNATGTTTVQSGATLQFTGTQTSTEPISVTGTGVGGLGALQGPAGADTTDPICTGAITLTGATTISTTSSNTSGTFTLNGAISGASNLTVTNASGTAAGYIRLGGNSTGLTGNVALTAGRLFLDHVSALGDAVGTTTVTAGAYLLVAGITISAEPLILNGSTASTTEMLGNTTYLTTAVWGGPITLNGPCYVRNYTSGTGDLSNLTISGQIGGTGNLIYNGTGVLTLSGNNNYSGETVCTSGSLAVTHVNGLGTTAGGTTITASTLSLSTIAIGAEPLSLGGGNTNTVATTGTCSWSGPVTLIEKATLGGAGTMTLSGVVSGGHLMTVTTGTYLLTNVANTFSGGVLVTGAGTLGAGVAASLGSTDQLITLSNGTLRATATFTVPQRIALVGAGTIAVDPTFTLTSSGIISGSGTLAKTLTGILVLTGSNTYSGITTITTGTLQGSTASLPGDIVDNAALIFDQATDGTYAGAISGTGTVTKNGAGILTLSSANMYAGLTTVSVGTLDVAHVQALGTTAAATTVSSGATLKLNGVSIQGETMNIAGTGVGGLGALIGIGSNTWTGTVTMTAATSIGGTGNDTLLSGPIGGAFALTKIGSGSYTFSGSNGYTGATNVNAGTLVVQHALGCGTSAGGVAVAGGATLRLGPVAVVTETLSLNGTGVGGLGALIGEGVGSWSGNVTLAAATTIGGDGNTTSLTGTIGGAFAIIKTGTGTLVTDNAGCTYSGNTTITQGTWRVSTNSVVASSNGPMGNSANGVILNGGTLEVNTATFSRGLSVTANGSRVVAYGADRTMAANISATGTFSLTTGGSANVLTLDGILSNGAGTLSLLTASPGTTTLNGVSTYTGSTTVQGGTLRLTNRLTGTTALTVSRGALLNLDSISADCLPDALTVTMRGGTLNMYAPLNTTRSETVSVVNIAEGANQISLRGSGTGNAQLTASGGYSRTAPASLVYDRVQGSPGTANLFLTGVVDATALAWSMVSESGTTSPGVYTTANGLVGQGTGDIVSTQSGNWNDGTTWVGGVAPVAGNTVTIAGAHVIALNGADRTIAGLNFSDGGTISAGNLLTVTGGGITVTGTGSPTIAATMSYGTGSGTILQSSSGTLTISNAISGSGDLVKLGTGTAVLSGTNTFGGAGQTVVVGAGTLSVGADAQFGNAANTVTLAGGTLLTSADLTSVRGLVLTDAGGSVAVATATTLTWNGVVSGTGFFTKAQDGSLVLAGANTYTGITTVGAGTLALSHASALGTTAGGTTVSSGASLQIGAVAIVGEGLTLNGTGVGGNGALLGSGTGSWSGTITLAADSSLGGTGNTTTLSGAIGGAFALTKAGTGTFALSAANTFTGLTTVSAGTLAAAHTQALGTTTNGTTVTAAATLRLDAVQVVGEGLTLNGTGVGTLGALLASGTSGWTGTIALASDSSLGGTGNSTLLSGVISGGFALTKVGSGTYTLTGANSYTGATAIDVGTLVAGNALATGTSAGGVTVADGATMMIDGVAVVTETLSVRGTGVGGLGALQGARTGSWSGAIDLPADATLGGTGNDTGLTGLISGAGGLIKIGTGTFAVNNVGSTFTGDTTIRAGILRVSNPVAISAVGPLGNTANEVLLDGGTLALNAATFTRNLKVTGDGSSIIAVAANRTLAGNITTTGARTLTLGS